MTGTTEQGVRIGLSAVVFTIRDRQACVLTTAGDATPADPASTALPFGPFDPAQDRTFERALRDFVTAQTGFSLGFVEQLYTFGDLGRARPRATPGPNRNREVSVGYLALTADTTDPLLVGAGWTPVLEFFPWEDRRGGPHACYKTLLAGLFDWAEGNPKSLARIDALFAPDAPHRRNEGRVLERYELLYEAGLVAESARDHDTRKPPLGGRMMVSDHRRILATGLGRLRSKLKYRPVLFDLMPDTFTLSELQVAAEAITGISLHKQNFRRGVERTGLVQPTGRLSSTTGGRPAELFRLTDGDLSAGETLGLPLPSLR